MTTEFASNCCTMALVVDGLDGSLKGKFPCMEFHCTHVSITTIEQLYHPLSHLPRYLSFPHRETSSSILEAFGLQTALQLWRTYKYSVSTVFGGNYMDEPYDPGADSKTFSRSCRPSDWSNLFGCQSTVTSAITFPTILYSAWDAVLIVVTRFGRHISQP